MPDITMPQLGETVTEGTIIKWLKKVGEEVHQDEVLFEVSTDKVDSEVPSPVSGVLTEILVPEGETVDVGARLAVVGDGGRVATTSPPAAETAPPPPPPEPAPPPQQTQPPPPPPPPVPRATQPAQSRSESSAKPAGRRQEAAATGAPGANGVVSSPMVRKLMADNAIDPSEVTPTGQGGRITRDDVLRLVDARKREPAPARGAAPPRTEGEAIARAAPVAAPSPGSGDEVVPFTNIRRRTAEHMVRSRATSAHTFTAVEADFENVDRVREAERERFKAEEGVNLTYLPFMVRAVVEGLREFPRLNASVGDDALILHHGLHIGIAVDLASEGLIVPVIHNADTFRLPALAREIADLAARARSRKLTADDISGGTFTITNPGPFHTLFTIPIINQPQVAILSTDGVKRRPVVVSGPDGEESIAIHSVGLLALSYDHRAVDGAYASQFLNKLREVIEGRDWYQEL